MYTQDIKERLFRSRFATLAAMALLLVLAGVNAHPTLAQTLATKTFSSPAEASNALFQAAQSGDERKLEAILCAGKDITSSGDDLEDKLEREQFIKKYEEMHRLVQEAEGSTILYIGAENWPFPIPLVSSKGVWHFDADAGRQEIRFRTIGENEATAIEVCNAFVAATKAGSPSRADDDPIKGYAQKLFLTLATDAAPAGSANDQTFHGYYFQTKKISGGTALIAYPEKYRGSGVMTFVVTDDGVVREKDLGPNTATVAPTVKASKVDSSWHTSE